MKKILVIIALGLSLFSCEPSPNYEPSTPVESTDNIYSEGPVYDDAESSAEYAAQTAKKFTAKCEFFSIGTNMDLTDESGKSLGFVEEKIFSIGSTFKYYDQHHMLLATAKEQIFSFGSVVNIYDQHNVKIGSIEEKVFESMFSFKSKYNIYDGSGKKIANSDKMDFFTSTVYIYNSHGLKIHMDKAYFSITDTWDIDRVGEIDERLFVFIPAFISSSQAERKEKEDNED